MILSVSRRTDIPARFMPWLENRFKEGYALVRHPMRPRTVYRVPLSPASIDGIVFWSKNPGPLLEKLHLFSQYPYYLQYTLNAYEGEMEQGLPGLNRRIETFQALSGKLGSLRVRWRYDPVLYTEQYSRSWHMDQFARLCQKLSGHTQVVTTSPYQPYAKALRNAKQARVPEDFDQLLKQMSQIAGAHGIALQVCPGGLAPEGVQAARCVDGALFRAIGAGEVSLRRDTGQRPECLCHRSVDLGAYDSCPNGCAYCYANRTPQVVARNIHLHDPESPLLVGWPAADDLVLDRKI